MILRAAFWPLLFALAACAPAAPPVDRNPPATIALPAMRVFGGPSVTPPRRSNADIAADFLDLTFMLESGRALPVFTRFEGPVTVRVVGQTPPSLLPDLDRLITRLRTEAGIDIRRVSGRSEASITIETISRADLQRAVPTAACFVVPRVTGWDDFRRNRRSEQLDWGTMRVRERISVFLPADVAPQEMRDCLHEELAQSLGPLNDLYRLPDSVFNDDNFHTVLTGFDMLILRATYAPELVSGMDRATVAARLPAILARLNPRGETVAPRPRQMSSRAWIDQIEAALGSRAAMSRRQEAAARAVALARAAGWQDNRLAFSLFALGRLSLARDPDLALSSFLQAGVLFGSDPDTAVHEAHIAMQIAAFAVSSGEGQVALEIIDRHTPVVRRAENAALLATLLLLKAEALELLGRPADAQAVRRESLGWARYGFGDDGEVRRRASEITALNPARRFSALTGGTP